jgi:hypothetical protein
MPVLVIQASKWGRAGLCLSLNLRATTRPIDLSFNSQRPRLWRVGNFGLARRGAPNHLDLSSAQPGPRSSKRASRKSSGNI